MVRDRTSDVSAVYRKLMRKDTPGEKLIGEWIWEYVLKFTSDVSLIRELTDALELPKDVPRLKQMILIKELSFQVLKGVEIEKTLNILEALHHAFEKPTEDKAGAEGEDRVLGRPLPKGKRMKASCSEASEGKRGVGVLQEKSAAKIRDVAGEDPVWIELQQPTLEMKEELQQFLASPMSENEDALIAQVKVVEKKLTALVGNAWNLFGPVFLERTEAAVKNGLYKPQGALLPLPVAAAPSMPDKVSEKDFNLESADVPDGARGELGRCVELPKDVGVGGSRDLERARKALADGCMELQKVVKDPLPALLRKLDGIGEVPVSTSGNTRETAEPATKRCLLDPHASAQAQRWEDDDDDEIQESPFPTSPSASRRVHLPPLRSPVQTTTLHPRKSLAAAESSMPVRTGTKQRRQKKKWSEEEVETLKREVRKYGKGRWKLILQNNLTVLHRRTEVDIKDKWRNLEKYNLV